VRPARGGDTHAQLGVHAQLLSAETAKDSELPAQARGYLNSLLPAVMPWVAVLPEAEVSAFAADLTRAVSSGTRAPERLAACLREWQATAEIHADQTESDRLRRALREADEGKVSPWAYDESSA
jgi:hypothetical protein